MKNVWLRLALSGLILIFVILALGKRHGTIPAMGVFLEPYNGIWALGDSPFERGRTGPSTLKLVGLSGKVEIQVDQDQIKHIFAENDDDLYFAQGYLIASERLWQMEFFVRLASGRLSEVLGEKALPIDKYFIKMGIPAAARESADLMLADSLTGPAIKAYAKGVNAFIQTLTPASLPFEYKLLSYKPEEWTPRNAALLLKFMAYSLSGFSHDLPLTRSRSRLSETDFAELFPLELPVPEPIIPKGTHWSFASRALAPPKVEFQADLKKLEPVPTPNPANGSNNWAVMGKKSTTGLPILSNDIHLDLMLPALWYEIQLVSPTQNVYGIALPGAPGVVLGFNRKLAWAVTNGGSDVLDWFELRYRDEKRNEYLFDRGWRPVISHEVEIKVRDSKTVHLSLRQTHMGPIVYDESETPLNPQVPHGLAMHWAALEPSNELKTFLQLNHASTTKECRKDNDTFQTPDQNFLCADNSGDVGMWHMGRYPIKWRGQGRLISNGASSAWEWKGWIPRDEVPSIRNPARGFVSSANQTPTDENYPHYLGWPFESPYRGMRINELLRSKDKFSPEDFVKMQGDTLSIPARTILPTLLKALKGSDDAKTVEKRVGVKGARALELLSTWDYRFTEHSTGATIFYTWYKQIENRMWKVYFPNSRDYMYPPIEKTLQLITREPDSKWFDDPTTPDRENFAQLAALAMKDTISVLTKETGSSNPDGWEWRWSRNTRLAHVGKIPGLGDTEIEAPGMEQTIFANQGAHGPVWKMVVALGPTPRAWGIFPGGESGDPRSPYYDNFLKAWSQNQLKELVYLLAPTDSNPRLSRKFILEKAAVENPPTEKPPEAAHK